MDKFPRAFERFESQVDIRDVETFHQLEMMFGEWAGYKWSATSKQSEALRREAEKRNLFGRYVHKERFCSKYENFSLWMARRPRTSAYVRRISNYMSSHPHATLREARGHRRG
jgi:hypothetical protein